MFELFDKIKKYVMEHPYLLWEWLGIYLLAIYVFLTCMFPEKDYFILVQISVISMSLAPIIVFMIRISSKKIRNQIKIDILIKKKMKIYNQFDDKSYINKFSELIKKLEKSEKMFNEMKAIDSGYKKNILTSKSDFEESLILQIKKFYFNKMNHFLLDFNENDSKGYINGFVEDLKEYKSNKYNSIIQAFIYDAESVLKNHSIIYNNYKLNPIKFYTDDISEQILEYIVFFDEISEDGIAEKFNVDTGRIKVLFEYFEDQKILSQINEFGYRKVLLKQANNVFSSGLNPAELSYFSVAYNDHIKTSSKNIIQYIDNDITGVEFEQISKEILENNGFENVQITSKSRDFGVDIIAEKDLVRYSIQCKKYSSSVGIKAIQEVIASKTMNNSHVAVVLTNNYFTKSAKELAEKNGVLLWDREKLKEFISHM